MIADHWILCIQALDLVYRRITTSLQVDLALKLLIFFHTNNKFDAQQQLTSPILQLQPWKNITLCFHALLEYQISMPEFHGV